MKPQFSSATEAWQQKDIPVIVRTRKRGGGNPKLRVRLPEYGDHYTLLKGTNKYNRNPVEVPAKRYWEVAYRRLNGLVEILANFYGKVILIQPVREKQVCARKCMEATGFECECSCLGANHGAYNMDSSWYEVDDTYAVRHGSEYASLKIIAPKDKSEAIF